MNRKAHYQMGRKVFITSALLCLLYIANAQNKVGLIIYDIKYPNENLNAKPIETYLFFNDSLSIGIAYATKNYTQESVGIHQEQGGIGMTFKYGDEKGEMIYRNFNAEKMTLRFPKSAALDAYSVNDSWLKIKWEIKDELLAIGKYTCKKAIGTFRGRVYIVWFTEEIPLPYGPFKLYGLPGLIIQAEDTEKMFSVTMKHIEFPTNQEFDTTEPIEIEKKSIREYAYIQDHFEDIFLEKINATMPKGIRLTKDPNKIDSKRKYKIEKVFEWEESPSY